MISEEDVLRVLDLSTRPLKAREIAQIIADKGLGEVTRSDVNSHLYRLKGRGVAAIDESYKWQLKKRESKRSTEHRDEGPRPSRDPKVETYYDILEVSRFAHAEIIAKAYKFLATRFHPDVADPSKRRQHEDRMKQINVAYEVLSDPKKREEYDKKVFA